MDFSCNIISYLLSLFVVMILTERLDLFVNSEKIYCLLGSTKNIIVINFHVCVKSILEIGKIYYIVDDKHNLHICEIRKDVAGNPHLDIINSNLYCEKLSSTTDNNNMLLFIIAKFLHCFDTTTRVSRLLDFSENVISLSCGFDHVFVVDSNFRVWSKGGNEYGQLGLGDNVDRAELTQVADVHAQKVACGNIHTLLRTREGNVLACGHNFGITFTHVASCISKIYCQGIKSYLLNTQGQILRAKSSSANFKLLELPKIKKITVGQHHVFFIDVNDFIHYD